MIYDGESGVTIDYNYLNLPRKVTGSGGTLVKYSYLANGSKSKAENGSGVGLVYRGSLIYRKAANGTLTLEGATLPEGRLTVNGVRWHVKDHLGSVRAVVDGSTGNLLAVTDYDAYGEDAANSTASPYLSPAPSGETFRERFTGKEDQGPDFGSAYTDFGARQYSPTLRRWLVPDPLSEKYYGISPYAYCAGNPVNLVDPDGKDGILIVFPDYQIHVGKRTYKNLGHAGVLLIDTKTGNTRYYEYGRYDKENKGVVRNVKVSDVILDKDNNPTPKSLNKVLDEISKKSGQGGRIEGAYVKSDEFDAMKDYAEQQMKENNNPERESYSLINNNCATFAAEVLSQDPEVDKQAPTIKSPRPVTLIKQYLKRFPNVQFLLKREDKDK